MTQLQWDQVGDRLYEAGVDRGVLYVPNGPGVSWNGLISVNEKTIGNELAPVFYEGVKIAEAMSPGDYAGSLRAYTYPDEFMLFEGTIDAGNGLYLGNQRPERFGLSYRTKMGNDVDGLDHSYKIHVLYNLLAIPAEKTYQTTQGVEAMSFEWAITAIPEIVPGYRPTAHLIFDTRYMDPQFISDIEDTLYGTESTPPTLPPISTLVSFSAGWVIIRITDNFDGTWTATGPDELFSMLDEETFQIIQANAVYLDEDTYAVTDSTH